MLALLLSLAPVLAGDDVVRLEAWPDEPTGLSTEISRLRKAGSALMAEEAHMALVEMGAGACPDLLKAYGKERAEDAQERLAAVIEEIVGPAHTRLLAEEFEHKVARVRVLALELVSRHPDAGLAGPAEKALGKATAARERAEKKGKDVEDVVLHEERNAALACISSGSLAGLDRLVALAQDDWKELGPRFFRAAPGARGPEATSALRTHVMNPETEVRQAALRLLAGVGDESGRNWVAPLLDHQDSRLKIASINALRGMVDGDPPLKKLSVFAAIEEAEKWKKRL